MDFSFKSFKIFQVPSIFIHFPWISLPLLASCLFFVLPPTISNLHGTGGSRASSRSAVRRSCKAADSAAAKRSKRAPQITLETVKNESRNFINKDEPSGSFTGRSHATTAYYLPWGFAQISFFSSLYSQNHEVPKRFENVWKSGAAARFRHESWGCLCCTRQSQA